MRTYEDYHRCYPHVAMERRDDIVELRLHTDDDSLVWGSVPHAELGHCFREVGADPTVRVVILTGSGTDFLSRLDDSWVRPMTPALWSEIYSNGRRLLDALLGIEVPVVAAVHGRTTVHAELALLSDIVIAADDVVFGDAPHFAYGTVPGDGSHVLWPHLLGPNRGRYFLLMDQRMRAAEALELGVVSEVLPRTMLRERSWEIATQLASRPDVILRYTREALTGSLRQLFAGGVGPGLALEGLGAFATWPTGDSDQAPSTSR